MRGLGSLTAVLLVALTALAAAAQEAAPPRTTTFEGVVAQVKPDLNLVILRMPDGKEMALRMAANSQITFNKQAIRLAELKVGTRVAITATEERDGFVGTSIVGPIDEAAAPAGRTIRGTVYKVIEPENTMLVKTADGKEVRLLIAPQTRMQWDRRAVKLADLPLNTAATIVYDVREGKYVVTSLEGPLPAVVVPPAGGVIVAAGNVQGVVMEGDRPQPNLQVYLKARDGRVVATEKTRPYGAFVFDNVAPGLYSVASAKAESTTVGETPVSVESGKTKSIVVQLVRP